MPGSSSWTARYTAAHLCREVLLHDLDWPQTQFSCPILLIARIAVWGSAGLLSGEASFPHCCLGKFNHEGSWSLDMTTPVDSKVSTTWAGSELYCKAGLKQWLQLNIGSSCLPGPPQPQTPSTGANIKPTFHGRGPKTELGSFLDGMGWNSLTWTTVGSFTSSICHRTTTGHTSSLMYEMVCLVSNGAELTIV